MYGPGRARLMLAVTVESYPELDSLHFLSDAMISPLVLQPGKTFAFRVSGQYSVAWWRHRDGEVVLFDPAGNPTLEPERLGNCWQRFCLIFQLPISPSTDPPSYRVRNGSTGTRQD